MGRQSRTRGIRTYLTDTSTATMDFPTEPDHSGKLWDFFPVVGAPHPGILEPMFAELRLPNAFVLQEFHEHTKA